jgi:hypothetical protein
VYVRVRNSGYQAASGVMLRGYYRAVAPGVEPLAPGLVWRRPPADGWIAMTPAGGRSLGTINPTPTGVAAPAPAGPLTWTPPAAGRYYLLIAVGSADDPSNIDPAVVFACAAGPTPLWRLVPFDNNLAARVVTAS